MCIIWVILIQLNLSLFSPPFVGVLKSGLDKQIFAGSSLADVIPDIASILDEEGIDPSFLSTPYNDLDIIVINKTTRRQGLTPYAQVLRMLR